MPRSRADIAIIAAYQDRDEIAAKLIVRHHPDLARCLQIDAEEVMLTEDDIRFWTLWPNQDGTWSHPESDTEAPLYTHLCSIASIYIFDAGNPRHVAALTSKETGA